MSIATSIVIPAYNESQRLSTGFERLRDVLTTMGVERTEVIVVDDGSTDDTMRVAHDVYGHLEHSLFVQQPVNRGKGAAVRLGIGLARGDNVVVADADMAIRPLHFPSMVSALGDAEIVPGSRSQGRHIRYDSIVRTVAGGAFNVLVRRYTGTTLRDTQCGCKGFQLGPARVLALLGMVDGFAFDAEVLFLARQLGLRIEPHSVTWDDVRGSSVRLRRDSLAMVHDLRSLAHTRYVNPVVELASDVDVEPIGQAARQVRVQGLVLARARTDSLLVLSRDGALGGVEIADRLGGTLRTTTLDELRGRTFEAV